MMNSDRFLWPIISQPAKSEAERPALFFRLAQMLMRSLQRCERETFWSNHLCLTHRVPLARAITVQRDEQWRRPRRRRNHVIVQIYLRCQFSFDGQVLVRRAHVVRL